MMEFAYWWTNPQTDYDAKVIGQADRAFALASDNIVAYVAKSNYLKPFAPRENEAVTSPTPVWQSIQILPVFTRQTR